MHIYLFLQELYPANDQLKLQDLVDTCQLMGSVLEFQQQAMGILTTGKLSDMIIESMKVSRVVWWSRSIIFSMSNQSRILPSTSSTAS